MDGYGWDVKGRPDLDLNPPNVLQSRLAESVENWRSPVDEHQGFHGWVLAPRCRNAYCPLCFYQDLVKGRTPYFRMDWMAVFTSMCWEHGTPLMEWADVDCHGRRRLPRGWLFRSRRETVIWPLHFSTHCKNLTQIDKPWRGEIGKVWCDVFAYLHGLQVAVEKRSAERMDVYPMAQSPKDVLRFAAKELVLSFASDGIPYDVDEAMSSWLYTTSSLIAGGIYSIYPRTLQECDKPALVDRIRQTDDLMCRRTYLYVAAKVLADFRQAITIDHPERRPWETWRWDDVWRAILANQACDFRFWCPRGP